MSGSYEFFSFLYYNFSMRKIEKKEIRIAQFSYCCHARQSANLAVSFSIKIKGHVVVLRFSNPTADPVRPVGAKQHPSRAHQTKRKNNRMRYITTTTQHTKQNQTNQTKKDGISSSRIKYR